MRYAIYFWILTVVLGVVTFFTKPTKEGAFEFFYFFSSLQIAAHFIKQAEKDGAGWRSLRATVRTGTIWHKYKEIL